MAKLRAKFKDSGVTMIRVEAQEPRETQHQELALEDIPHWYAVYTYPRHEKAVAEHLDAQGISFYVPTLRTASRWKDRIVHLDTPVFPGYVFAQIGFAQRTKILGAPGVVRILCFNGRPAPIEDHEIDALRLCLNRGAKVERCSLPGLGDRVRVRSGMLQGLVGHISRCKEERRLIIPISLIYQSVAIEVDVELLEPVNEPYDPHPAHRHGQLWPE